MRSLCAPGWEWERPSPYGSIQSFKMTTWGAYSKWFLTAFDYLIDFKGVKTFVYYLVQLHAGRKQPGSMLSMSRNTDQRSREIKNQRGEMQMQTKMTQKTPQGARRKVTVKAASLLLCCDSWQKQMEGKVKAGKCLQSHEHSFVLCIVTFSRLLWQSS